jgi:hypothetical protein
MNKLPPILAASALAIALLAPATSQALPAVQRTTDVAAPAVQGGWLLMLVAHLRAGFGG